MMIVEDNGAYYVVKSVFLDKVIGPFDNKEEAENWINTQDQQPRTKEAATMSDENERSVASAGSVAGDPRNGAPSGCETVRSESEPHSPDKCAGEHCCIHNPSPHHMVTWPMRWRADAGKMERVCEHGVGHPDPDDAAYWERLGQGFRNIHGCDGCCRPPKA